ncbi:baeRF2 domain-containing protein [Streptomyces sp. 4N509B]|uniref:baeRF2 domain-containing protein n=1 Tax=Streptomyces sp. 4N509B TaxID=3457413 RepID=UPI003FCF2CAB
MRLDVLEPLLRRPGPWASAYLATTRHARDDAQVQELHAREIRDLLGEQGADDATRRALYEAMLALGPDRQGQALFATAGEVVLTVPLTTAPPRGLGFFGPLPRLAPLVEYAAGEPACLVAFVDRGGADLELRHGGGPSGWQGRDRTESAGHVSGTTPLSRVGRGTDLPGRGPGEGTDEVPNSLEENADLVAEAIAADARRTGAEVLVLAGDPRQRRAVHERLPVSLREAATETEHGGRGPGAGSGSLDEDVDAARAERARRRTAEVVDRFLAGLGNDAAEGVPALVEAAREHRLATLLLRPGGGDLGREVWAGPEPDQLAVRRTDAAYLGSGEPFAARADDALLRAAVATDVEVVLVRPDADGVGDSPTATPVGGLGALLRWPYGEAESDHGQARAA